MLSGKKVTMRSLKWRKESSHLEPVYGCESNEQNNYEVGPKIAAFSSVCADLGKPHMR
jgi:hypothetical protein